MSPQAPAGLGGADLAGDSTELFAGVKSVDERLQIDEQALAAWLAAHVPGYAGPLEVSQFRGGQSNPTYRLVTPSGRYVLRRKPPGVLLPSAHAVEREYRVLAALQPSGFPVPRPLALCTDPSVIGTAFYLMEMVEGRVVWDDLMAGSTPVERRATYYSAVRTLAQLHCIDPLAVGLGDFGRPGNYFARQIDRWSRQYRSSETESIPQMDALIEWLPTSVPAGGASCLVHGDYRLDNLMLHPREAHVIAVLDWELSTLGDPLADLTHWLLNWVLPAGLRSPLGTADLAALGIPRVDELVAQYCAVTGRSDLPRLDWYFAYNSFRLACILQGIVGRVRDGTAANAHAARLAGNMRPLAAAAHAFARSAGL